MGPKLVVLAALALFMTSGEYKPYQSKYSWSPRQDVPSGYHHLSSQSSNENVDGRVSGYNIARDGSKVFLLRIAVTTSTGKVKECGGFLFDAFDAQFALTAGHCLVDEHYAVSPKQVRITAGKRSFKATGGSNNEQSRTPAWFVIHEGFAHDSNTRVDDDIAILFFKPPFHINSYVGTIELNGSIPPSLRGLLTYVDWIRIQVDEFLSSSYFGRLKFIQLHFNSRVSALPWGKGSRIIESPQGGVSPTLRAKDVHLIMF